MAIQLTVMIEGQEGLTWERWRALARTVEDAGYAGLYRSDHLTGLFGDPSRSSLETWASLTWLASHTQRIRFGPLVCPLTFYHPALLAKRAAAVAELSGGRLDLGIGAGWHEGEHAMFGIPFPSLKERMDRFECGARVIRALWRGRPVTLEQPYYPLREAQSYPLPPGGGVPLIVGGRGERRTLRIVAEHADEWNVWGDPDLCGQKAQVLAQHCEAIGRDPSTILHSTQAMMFLSEDEEWLSGKRGNDIGRPVIVGNPNEVTDIVGRYRDAGIDELIVPEWNFGPMARRKETLDLFIERVAPSFR